MPISDKYNALYVNTEGQKPTYKVAVLAFTPVATPTDIITLSGSATKIIKVKKAKINCDASAAGVLDFYIYKRTSANTGGTATAQTIAKADSSDVDPTAVVNLYTANPSSLGTGVLFGGDRLATPNAAVTGYPMFPYRFFPDGGKALTLRGVNEFFAVNLNGAALPTGTKVYVTIEWTEEVQ